MKISLVDAQLSSSRAAGIQMFDLGNRGYPAFCLQCEMRHYKLCGNAKPNPFKIRINQE